MTMTAAEISRLAGELNETWRSGRFDELRRFFHPDVVFVHFRFEQRTRGRDTLIASYADFSAKARVLEFTTGDTLADIIAASAVSTTPWRMIYEFEGATYDESGWDLLVWCEHEGAWVVVWRTMVLDVSES